MDVQNIIEEKKEKLLSFMQDDAYHPMKIKEIMIMLQIPSEERTLLEELLQQLVSEGKIIITKRGKYALPQQLNLYPGVFQGNRTGFGFVLMDDPEMKDVFIPKDCTMGAVHKDRVLVKIYRPEEKGKRAEGEVVEIIDHGAKEIVGTFQRNKNFGFVVPDDDKHSRDIYIPKKMARNAINGHKVVVRIIKWPQGDKKPEGKIVEVLGHITDPTTDILAIVRQHEIPTDFPDEVLDEIENIATEVKEQDKIGREDLRDLQMVTIDGEDAKDLDDAISLEKLENGNYRLGVHIADVTHYVKEDRPLDKEAFKRSTSVYLVDRVIPMLPRKLSNGICSLNANVDRLALSCIMDIDSTGNVVAHKILETLINIDKRMTYTNVKKILEEEPPELMEEYKNFIDFFKRMKELAIKLREKRTKRGSLDFDFEEAKIYLDETGKPVEIKPYERNIATRIIEEFMLICNETIAEDYYWQELPFIYRSHEEPNNEKIQSLGEFIYNFGYHIKGGGGQIHPKAIQKILDDIEGSKEEAVISRLVLRSMKQARYTHEMEGHFGLAAKYYCHFTSPIRRYPDLQIHRIIKENINGRLTENRIRKLLKQMPEVAKQCSVNERRAEDAERETEKLKMVEYMSDRIGKEYDGIISGITNWGMYVELPNTVEGMVHVTNMKDDYYNYDEKLHVFVGERTRKVYRLGDRVKIKVMSTDKVRRIIDFIIIEENIENHDNMEEETLKEI